MLSYVFSVIDKFETVCWSVVVVIGFISLIRVAYCYFENKNWLVLKKDLKKSLWILILFVFLGIFTPNEKTLLEMFNQDNIQSTEKVIDEGNY